MSLQIIVIDDQVSPLFSLGQLVATPGAIAAFTGNEAIMADFVMRHWQGDWGEVSQDDWSLNNEALRRGERLVSAYTLPKGERILIITEWDRSCTTVLLIDEY